MNENEIPLILKEHFSNILIENINAIVALIEPDGRMTYINKYASDFLGLSIEEVSSEPYFWMRFIPKTDIEDIKVLVKKAQDGILIQHKQNPWYNKNGEERIIEWSNALIHNQENQKPHILTVGIDITEKIVAQKELKEINKNLKEIIKDRVEEIEQSRYLVKQIIDTAPVRIFWKDKNGVYLGANKLFLKDANLESEDDIIGKTDYDMVWKNEAELYIQDDFKVMQTRESKLRYEEPQTTSDGNTIFLITSKVPLVDKDNNIFGILGVYDDITEQKNIQMELNNRNIQLFEQSKMVSLGEMIGNIAHQWRQPLNTITTAISGLLIKMEYDKESVSEDMIREFSEIILRQANYLSSTIDTFRNFIKEKKEFKEVVLQERITTIIDIIGTSLKNNHIDFELNMFDTPIKIKLVTGELDQVIINLFNNAKDILLERKIENPKVTLDLKLIDDNVLIIVEDNGGGIDLNILPKIFDPYFTTKHQSVGTGLGLHMSYKIIVESFHGKLYAKNSDKGAKFYIEIPLKDKV